MAVIPDISYVITPYEQFSKMQKELETLRDFKNLRDKERETLIMTIVYYRQTQIKNYGVSFLSLLQREYAAADLNSDFIRNAIDGIFDFKLNER